MADSSDYNNLNEIEDLRHEIVNGKKDVRHDHLFKVIIIGSSGKKRMRPQRIYTDSDQVNEV